MRLLTRLVAYRDGEDFVLESADTHIKQVFFGWASWGTGLRTKEHPEYYGRDTEPASKTDPDSHRWQWRLSPDSVDDLKTMIYDAGFKHMEDENEASATEHVFNTLEQILEDES